MSKIHNPNYRIRKFIQRNKNQNFKSKRKKKKRTLTSNLYKQLTDEITFKSKRNRRFFFNVWISKMQVRVIEIDQRRREDWIFESRNARGARGRGRGRGNLKFLFNLKKRSLYFLLFFFSLLSERRRRDAMNFAKLKNAENRFFLKKKINFLDSIY